MRTELGKKRMHETLRQTEATVAGLQSTINNLKEMEDRVHDAETPRLVGRVQ